MITDPPSMIDSFCVLSLSLVWISPRSLMTDLLLLFLYFLLPTRGQMLPLLQHTRIAPTRARAAKIMMKIRAISA